MQRRGGSFRGSCRSDVVVMAVTVVVVGVVVGAVNAPNIALIVSAPLVQFAISMASKSPTTVKTLELSMQQWIRS